MRYELREDKKHENKEETFQREKNINHRLGEEGTIADPLNTGPVLRNLSKITQCYDKA